MKPMKASHDCSALLKKLMGSSDKIQKLIEKVNRVAKSNFTVIIFGETGVGKELVSRAIHQASSRSQHPFVAVDCGALQENLLESELFGHEQGAFTGAIRQKSGRFEEAKNGTLLLDEISNMTLGAQVKLLRALQEKTIYRVGGTQPYHVDVRVLVSCNENLQLMNTNGTFRPDLYYRLNEFTIKVPALKERVEDIPYLVQRFIDLTNQDLDKRVQGVSPEAMRQLEKYDWPGNVRQLRSTIRRAVLLADKVIQGEHLDLEKKTEDPASDVFTLRGRPWETQSLKEIVGHYSLQVEKAVLTEVMKETQGNKAHAARLLQVDYKTLLSKLKSLNIS